MMGFLVPYVFDDTLFGGVRFGKGAVFVLPLRELGKNTLPFDPGGGAGLEVAHQR